VRELYNALEFAVSESLFEPVLFPKHLPTHIRAQAARAIFEVEPQRRIVAGQSRAIHKELPQWKDFRKSYIAEAEQKYLHELLSQSEGNIQKAARLSGLSQPRLYELLRKHKIST
jgi:two-component system NtrC family response regulator